MYRKLVLEHDGHDDAIDGHGLAENYAGVPKEGVVVVVVVQDIEWGNK